MTAPVGTTLKQVGQILQKHRIEKLPLIDEAGILKGLITIKDIEKVIESPNSAKDKHGGLIAAAVVGIAHDTFVRVGKLF
ncbi:hypothetical protein AWI87_15055 [Listeria monocytogenes]|nr:hypothetical protein AWI87_15055 [Listeria monocytogenes]